MERAEDLAGASETVKVRAKAGELAEVSEQWKAQGSVRLKDSKMVLHWDQESEERMVKTWESLLAQLSVLPSALLSRCRAAMRGACAAILAVVRLSLSSRFGLVVLQARHRPAPEGRPDRVVVALEPR